MRSLSCRIGLLPAASALALAGAAGAAETVTYSYDALGRLTATSTTGTVNNGATTAIGYDPAGNRSSYTAGVGGAVGGGGGGGGGGGEPPAGAVFAVGDSSAPEGGSLVFTVTRTGGTGGASSVGYATANGSAEAGSDYQQTSGTLTFAAAETSRTVTVTGMEDSLDENEETLFLNLSAASPGASIADGQGVGTLADNDEPPPPPPNNPPTAVANTGSQPKCTTATYNVIANDTDADADYPLTLVSASGLGFAKISSTSVEFTSGASTGTKNGSYVVQDSRGAQSTGSVNVVVSGGSCQNLAPPPPVTGGGGGS
ncbi:MAG TPA: Calx-beta domain-containing protein [Allosphingosinicella sp.]|jgi:hypothetical protein